MRRARYNLIQVMVPPVRLWRHQIYLTVLPWRPPKDIAEAVEKGLIDPTDTEKERRDLTAADVAAALAVDLANDGLEESMASAIARWAGNNGVGFVIVPGRVSGTALFDVHNDHGTVRVVLNQEHRLFRVY